MDLIQKVQDLIAAVRAADYWKAAGIALEILNLIRSIFPAPAQGMKASTASETKYSSYEVQTADELTASLENHLTAPEASAPTSAWLEALALMILAMLRKLWVG